jgi:hypothetical protein
VPSAFLQALMALMALCGSDAARKQISRHRCDQYANHEGARSYMSVRVGSFNEESGEVLGGF